tara:strand:- start:3996 stop:4520 length:525 start_codon:yes stop_codon:yes gene_type:complete
MICSNGLVDILDNKKNETINNKFKLMDKIPVKTVNTIGRIDIGSIESTPLSDAFFSNQNINNLHILIIKGVYDKSNIIIEKQNTEQLLGIMRNIFMNPNRDEFMSRYISQPTISDNEQLNKFNQCVINSCVKIIHNQITSYLKYREDISTLAVPQDLPILSNSKNKTLELKPWF